MVRNSRIETQGAWHHVIIRGIENRSELVSLLAPLLSGRRFERTSQWVEMLTGLYLSQ
jgi:hypothetical protein